MKKYKVTFEYKRTFLISENKLKKAFARTGQVVTRENEKYAAYLLARDILSQQIGNNSEYKNVKVLVVNDEKSKRNESN